MSKCAKVEVACSCEMQAGNGRATGMPVDRRWTRPEIGPRGYNSQPPFPHDLVLHDLVNLLLSSRASSRRNEEVYKIMKNKIMKRLAGRPFSRIRATPGCLVVAGCGGSSPREGEASAVNTMSRLVSGPALAAGSAHRGSSGDHILVGQRSREPAASAVPLTG